MESVVSLELVKTIRDIFKWGFLALIVFFIGNTVVSLSTHGGIAIKIIGNITIDFAMSWTITIGSCIYGWKQRQLRRRSDEVKNIRIRYLEKIVWPDRPSSETNDDGTTKKEDL